MRNLSDILARRMVVFPELFLPTSAAIGALPSNAAVGLWTFNGVEGKSAVPMGPQALQEASYLAGTLQSNRATGPGAAVGAADPAAPLPAAWRS